MYTYNEFSVLVNNIIVVAICFGYLTAKPYHTSSEDLDILYNQENETGNYEFHVFEKVSKKEEIGKIEQTKEGTDVPKITGYYYYEEELKDKDVAVSVNYTADEKGFRATFKIKSSNASEDDRLGSNCIKSLCVPDHIG